MFDIDDVKNKLGYDPTNEDSILNRASLLVGKDFKYIADSSPYKQSELNPRNKGEAGLFIERHWFGIPRNTSPQPDFEDVGIEVKLVPLKMIKKGLTIKEDTKTGAINYINLISEEWNTSKFKNKMNKVLFIFYIYENNQENFLNQSVEDCVLWELSHYEDDLKPDWLKLRQKVRDGLAHELSMLDFTNLGPKTSGSSRLKNQPNTKYSETAKERSFALKNKYVKKSIWEVRPEWIRCPNKFESIFDTLGLLEKDDIEKEFLRKLNKYIGKTVGDISKELNIPIPNAKNAISIIIKKIIGFHNAKSKIKEFEKSGILVKTIPIRMKDLKPYEAISFPAIKFKEFEDEEWDDSLLSEQLTRILFTPVSRDKRKGVAIKDRVLEKPFFWSPSDSEEVGINKEWLQYQSEVRAGKSKVTKHLQKNGKYKEITSLSKESDTQIIHMRPHGTKTASDRDVDSFGNSFVKHSFWLNKSFIQKLAKEHLISR